MNDLPLIICGLAVLTGALLFALWRWRQRAIQLSGLAPPPLSSADSPAALPVSIGLQAQTLIARGKNLQALKLILEHTHGDMRRAQEQLQTLMQEPMDMTAIAAAQSQDLPLGFTEDILAAVGSLMGQGRKIEAIKLVRMHSDWDLKTAKQFVEESF